VAAGLATIKVYLAPVVPGRLVKVMQVEPVAVRRFLRQTAQVEAVPVPQVEIPSTAAVIHIPVTAVMVPHGVTLLRMLVVAEEPAKANPVGYPVRLLLAALGAAVRGP